MDCCMILPPISSMWRKKYSVSNHHHQLEMYQPLIQSQGDSSTTMSNWVKVIVGKENKEFFVDPFVLEENPFRVLIQIAMRKVEVKQWRIVEGGPESKRVIFVDVDSILFEHMLWLLQNDCSSFSKLNLEEIIEFYSQE